MATPPAPTPAGRGLLTPISARVAVLLVVALDAILESRTFVDAQTGLDTVLGDLLLPADCLALAMVVLGLRGAPVSGFKHRARPIHLKVVMVLSAIALVLWLHLNAVFNAADHWSQLHAHDRFEIAANFLVALVVLDVVEARIGTPPGTPLDPPAV